MLRLIDLHNALSLAVIILVTGNMTALAHTQQKPGSSAGAHEICSIEFSKNSVRPARVQNNAFPCLEQAARFLREHPDRKLVVVGAKNPKRDHEPAYVDSDREEEDVSGFAVRLEDLSAYRAVNTKWYLVHNMHSDATRVLPTTDEAHFAQSVSIYDVPGSANFNRNFLNTTKINEVPCTIQPCYSPDEETLKAQPRSRIVAGTPESTAQSSEERRSVAAQRRQARSRTAMNGEQEKLAPLPPIPTPDRPATASIIP